MSFITAALIGAGTSLVGGMLASDAAGDAAATQAASADRATQLQKEMFDRQVELQKPFRDAGLAAQNKLLSLLGLTAGGGDPGTPADYIRISQELLPQYATNGVARDPAEFDRAIRERLRQENRVNNPEFGSLMRDFGMSDFQADPGYSFRQSEGQKALERSAAARGGLLSGRAMKDTMRFGQDLASQEYGNAFNRFQTNRANKLNPLQSLSGGAQTAANQVAGAANTFGQQAGNNAMAAGNARASGYVGSANAINNAIGTGWNMYQQNQMMNMLRPRQTASGGSFGAMGPSPYDGYGGLDSSFDQYLVR